MARDERLAEKLVFLIVYSVMLGMMVGGIIAAHMLGRPSILNIMLPFMIVSVLGIICVIRGILDRN